MLRAYMDFYVLRELHEKADRAARAQQTSLPIHDLGPLLDLMTRHGTVTIWKNGEENCICWQTSRARYYGQSGKGIGLALKDCVRAALLPPETIPAAGLPGVVEYPGKEG